MGGLPAPASSPACREKEKQLEALPDMHRTDHMSSSSGNRERFHSGADADRGRVACCMNYPLASAWSDIAVDVSDVALRFARLKVCYANFQFLFPFSSSRPRPPVRADLDTETAILSPKRHRRLGRWVGRGKGHQRTSASRAAKCKKRRSIAVGLPPSLPARRRPRPQ